MSKQVKAKETFELRDKEYQLLFTSDLGKKVLEDMKQSLGYGQTLYQEKTQNNDLAFHLGRQSVINQIVYILNSNK